jgi:short-subunit dehydrogenase
MKIFITGASSGIGQALAHEYAKRIANTTKINASENNMPASRMAIGQQFE